MGTDRRPRGEVQHELLDLIDAASALKISDGVQRAAEFTERIDDVDTLRRIAAGLAMVVAFDLVSNPRPGPAAIARHRARLAPWMQAQRFNATWQLPS